MFDPTTDEVAPAEAESPLFRAARAQLRSAIQVALDALEIGDAAFAVEVLLGALEDGPAERRHRCSECGLGFEWPGLRVEHVRAAHPVSTVVAVAGRAAA